MHALIRLKKIKKKLLPTWHNHMPDIERDAALLPSLHLGSGGSQIYGAISVDINSDLNPDIVWDLNVFPYPFEAGTFDVVIALSIIEHLDDFFGVMGEIHRISRPNASIYILVPHFSSMAAYADPTHRRLLSALSCDYFINGTTACNSYGFYVKYRYEMVRRYVSLEGVFSLVPGLERIISRKPTFWERHLCYMLSGAGIFWHLRVNKR